MCGIFGYYDLMGNSFSDTLIKSMGNIIHHRGPDGQGIYHDEDCAVALGNQRLAILDIEQGQQPFFSDDGNIIVVQNGEIFNHIELAEFVKESGFPCKTHCDTEVILRLYEMEGISLLSRLNGMFAIAIFDKRTESLFIARDRVGEKPLYYSFQDERLIYCSEIKGMIPCYDKVDIELNALEQFMAFNYVPSPITMFKGIYHLKPGHYIELNKSAFKEHCWWDLSKIEQESKTEEEWITEFNEILDDAVRLRLRADVDFGAFLSGGVDSTTVVGLMAKHMDKPVKTYTIGFDDPLYDESPYAQEAAIRFNTEHHLEKVHPNLLALWPSATYHSDQPHGDISFLPTYKVAEFASRDVKMVLTGDGADELFAGYDKYKDFFSTSDYLDFSDEEFITKYSDNLSLFDDVSRNKLFNEKTKKELIKKNVISDKIKPLLDSIVHMDRINKALFIDTQLLLSGNNLVKPDRMGMAVSIENRAPFLDYRMIELAFKIPGHLKLKNGETKYIYKKAVSNLIGEHLTYRKKQMFTVPVGEWFKNEAYDLCKDLLISDKVIKRDFFDYKYVESLLEQHVSGISNNTREIRALMAFEYWCREFLD